MARFFILQEENRLAVKKAAKRFFIIELFRSEQAVARITKTGKNIAVLVQATV